MGNTHVANGSDKYLRVRVTQERVTISDIDIVAKAAAGTFSVAGGVKASLDHTLDTTGFARLAPGEALEFDVDEREGDVYVSIMTADDPEPMIIAYNFTPPEHRSVIVTEHLTLQLSQRFGSVWTTQYGVSYGPENAKKITKQKSIQQKQQQQQQLGSSPPSDEVDEMPQLQTSVVTVDECCSVM